jgi:hypothetical protein
MVEGRDFYRGEIASGDGRSETEHPARTDSDVIQRARYLAKAASLGQVVMDDDAASAER